jgi:hypothetical protein
VIPSFGSTRQAPTQADELERLAGLKAQGLLTDAEFAAAKAQALGTVDSEQPGP